MANVTDIDPDVERKQAESAARGKQKEAEKLKRLEEKASEFSFIDGKGKELFSCPPVKMIDGVAYNAIEDFKRNNEKKAKKAAAPLTIEWIRMPKNTIEELKAYNEFAQQHRDEMEEEDDRLNDINHANDYELFRRTLDTSGLTEAQKTMIASDHTSEFWLHQDLEKIRSWGSDFRKRVGI